MYRRSFLKAAGVSAGAILGTRFAQLAGAKTAKPQKFLAGFAPATDGSLESFWHNMEACAKVGFHNIEVDNSRVKLAQAYVNRIS